MIRPERHWAFVTHQGRTLQAHRIRGDMSGHVSCPHCGIGQVRVEMSYICAYCRARVTDVCTLAQRREKESQLQMLFGA